MSDILNEISSGIDISNTIDLLTSNKYTIKQSEVLLDVLNGNCTSDSCGGPCYTGDGWCSAQCSSQCHDYCGSSGECTSSGEESCTSCAGCDYCNTCQGCNSCNTCQGCDGCDTCQGCNYCNTCQGCQVCNTCQAFCETNQYISGKLGQFNYNTSTLNADAYSNTSTYDVNSIVIYNGVAYKCIIAVTSPEEWDITKWIENPVPAYEIDWNGLIDYLNKGANIAKVTFPTAPASVELDEQLEHARFNEVNSAINSFLNSVTGLNNKEEYEKLLTSDMSVFRKTVNNAKIGTDIPCCEVTGYETCITCQSHNS